MTACTHAKNNTNPDPNKQHKITVGKSAAFYDKFLEIKKNKYHLHYTFCTLSSIKNIFLPQTLTHQEVRLLKI